MSKKNVEENLMDFNSPSDIEKLLNNETNSPGSNPFDTIMNIAETYDSMDFENELFKSGNIEHDCSRDSLGILHVDFERLNFEDTNWLDIPQILVNEENASSISNINSQNELNTAFLYSSGFRDISKIKSSVSSIGSSLSSWELSKISHPNLLNDITNVDALSILNKGFFNSNDKVKYTENNQRKNNLIQNTVTIFRQRMSSLPSTLFSMDTVNEKNKTENINLGLRKFRKSDSLLKQSFSITPILRNKNKQDNVFEDSVFIEGSYLASKIADKSIYNMGDGESFLLDSTPQPEWLDECDKVLEENTSKDSSNKIFKAIDKIIPSTNSENLLDVNRNTSRLSSNSSANSSLSKNECVQCLTDIFSGETKKLSTSRLSQCSNNSKSKDAKSLLHNLSEILNSDNPTIQQKSDGQNLLFSLADMLCSNDTQNSSCNEDHSEDSGHSSIDHDALAANKLEDNENCDVLDLRISSETPLNEIKPLDLSISKRKDRVYTNSNLSRSNNESTSKISTPPPKFNCTQKDKSNDESNYSNISKNMSNLKTNISGVPPLSKLKPKKIDKKLIPEKGPLKATIPVGDMSKPKRINGSSRIGTTPPKSGQYNSMYKIKRTSTPKSGTTLQKSKPQPIAQSTPETNPDIKKRIPTPTYLRQARSEGLIPLLSRTNSVDKQSVDELSGKNRSGSTPNLSSSSCNNSSTMNSNQIMFRRRSASDLKSQKGAAKLKRSNTIDKDTGISKSLGRVRESIEKSRKSPLAGTKAAATVTKNSHGKAILGERNQASMFSNIKPCNLVNKIRRSAGKENVK